MVQCSLPALALHSDQGHHVVRVNPVSPDFLEDRLDPVDQCLHLILVLQHFPVVLYFQNLLWHQLDQEHQQNPADQSHPGLLDFLSVLYYQQVQDHRGHLLVQRGLLVQVHRRFQHHLAGQWDLCFLDLLHNVNSYLLIIIGESKHISAQA